MIMNTPICDFVKRYNEKNPLRLHMPGHKGKELLGYEAYDITEITGADSLYEASGIIAESENNASTLFSCPTFYSTEGSSHCIRAMLYLVCMYARKNGREKALVLAARNCHKTFVSACAMLDFDIEWLYGSENDSYLSCNISTKALEKKLSEMESADRLPTAVYITSPDYLGNICDISSLSEVCKKFGVLLIVDNAHGGYLKFLEKSQFPTCLGADICCSSAHKTLPVITGGAYLHISQNADSFFVQNAKNALALFGTTSPSYLILQSLDYANKYISESYISELSEFLKVVQDAKHTLAEHGYTFIGNEPLKLTLDTKKYGYYGKEIAEYLEKSGIYCEFCDRDYIVFMLTPNLGKSGLERLTEALLKLPKKWEISEAPPKFRAPVSKISIREAIMSAKETIPIKNAVGRVLGDISVACPPAVPILVCGEEITQEAVAALEYYGVEYCTVIADKN